jgi:hypothetical protein
VGRFPRVVAHRVTRVVSLAALAIIAVVALAYLSASWWTYALVLLVLAGTVGALIRYPQLGLQSQHLFKYMMATLFQGFDSELSQVDPPKALTEANRALEERRRQEYKDNRGLFLGHYWKPSEEEGQTVDIRIQLRDHPDPDSDNPTPLEAGKVESVTYYLGPKFSETATTKTASGDAFALDVSAYGPMLCHAVVSFNDGTEPLSLSRYIDFPEDLQTTQVAGASAQILYDVEAPLPRPWWRRLLGRR